MRPTRRCIEEALASFISEQLVDAEPEEGLDPLESDAVDSLGLEQLAQYIEREFGVAIQAEDMVRRNFSSIGALTDLIDSKLGDATV